MFLKAALPSRSQEVLDSSSWPGQTGWMALESGDSLISLSHVTLVDVTIQLEVQTNGLAGHEHEFYHW